MKKLQTCLKRVQETPEEDNGQATSKQEWKVKITQCAVASATKDLGKFRLEVWIRPEDDVDNGKLLLEGAVREIATKCDEENEEQYVIC